MMRILNIAYTCPWPPHGGNNQRVWHLCRLLGRFNHQELLCRVMAPSGAGFHPRFQGEPVDVHNLYLPRPGSLTRLVKGFRYLCRGRPVLSAGFDFHAYTAKLKTLIREGRFDIIVMDGIWLGAYWPLIRDSGALSVLNHFDQESVSMRRHAALFADWRKTLYNFDAARMESMERRVMDSADLIWVTSEVDRDAILKEKAMRPVHVAPNGVDTDEIRFLEPEPSHEILFVGTLSQPANADAVTYFARDIFPLLRAAVPDAVFRVIGRNPGPDIRELGHISGVTITGPVDDVTPWYRRCAAAVVPLRAGGGTRLKILEAMAYGRPVVSTIMGCEGIQAESGRHVFLADTPRDIAAALRDILVRPDEAACLSREARKLVEERYSWKRIASGMQVIYEQRVQARLKKNGNRGRSYVICPEKSREKPMVRL